MLDDDLRLVAEDDVQNITDALREMDVEDSDPATGSQMLVASQISSRAHDEVSLFVYIDAIVITYFSTAALTRRRAPHSCPGATCRRSTT